jgi:hypothetical protein
MCTLDMGRWHAPLKPHPSFPRRSPPLSIAAGPMAGGLYKVRVAVTGIPKGELANAVKKLQQDKVVRRTDTTGL